MNRHQPRIPQASAVGVCQIKSCQLLAYAILKKLRTGTKKEGKTLAAVCIDPKDLGTVEKVALEILYDLGLIERTATYFHLKTED